MVLSVPNLDLEINKSPNAISSLTGNQESRIYKNCDEKDVGPSPIFSIFPRPPEVERLRSLANGPSPLAQIPNEKIVLGADGDPGTSSDSDTTTTHIYCKPFQMPELQNCRNKISADNAKKSDKSVISSVKMPSSVVPIDVSGQPFSRMASFRRSLIHVDFFIRRKKKDKRRNTVTEGDTKELKSALQNIINDEHNICVPNGTLTKKLFSNGTLKSEKNLNKKVSFEEANNNFPKDFSVIKDKKESLKNNSVSEQDKEQVEHLKKSSEKCPNSNALINESKDCPNYDALKKDSKNCFNSDAIKSYINCRIPRSNLPISTSSAAMNVAVEMRQLTGVEDHSSSSNLSCSSDHNSTDSGNKKSSDKGKALPSTVSGEDSGFSDSFRNRSKDNCKSLNPKVMSESEDTEAFSSASSENTAAQDDQTSNATSVESDSYLMSSDESDEDLSAISTKKCGSSTSINTMSDGSLNSLLSQTATEMTSSTGTLTSLGQERLPTPPPPPPSFVMVPHQKEIVRNALPVNKKSNKVSNIPISKNAPKPETSSKKVNSPKKSSRSDKPDQRKTDNSKGIFNSFGYKKSRVKELVRDINVRSISTMTPPSFDMYGFNSPEQISRPSIFEEEEDIQSLSKVESKAHLQSFLPKSVVNKGSCKEVNNRVRTDTISSTENKVHSVPNTTPNAVSSKNNVEIPLKYVHKVVVTPKSRQEENKKYTCRKSLFNDTNDHKPMVETDASVRPKNYTQQKNRKGETCSSAKPERPKTLHTGVKHAARVVLDPEGRVIYSTNSLDRCPPYPNHYHSTVNNFNDIFMLPPPPPPPNEENYLFSLPNEDYMYPPPPPSIIVSEPVNHNRPSNTFSLPTNNNFQNTQRKPYDYPSYDDENSANYSSPISNTHLRNSGDNSRSSELSLNNPCTGQRNYCHNIAEETNKHDLMDDLKMKMVNSTQPRSHFKSPPSYEEAVGRLSSRTVVGDPNVSGLPTPTPMLTEENLILHLQNIERLTNMNLENIADSYKSLLTPQTNKSPLDSNLNQLQKSTMSTEDLFAMIHDCKKRMNIKSESDISFGSSSQSKSPLILRPPPAKGVLAETGFLSPRNVPPNLNDVRDRRSWADFRPASSSDNNSSPHEINSSPHERNRSPHERNRSPHERNSSPHERKSLASDRLRRTNHTSMHDFKMLLLQARSTNYIAGPRRSAVEMLRVSQAQNNQSPVIGSQSYQLPVAGSQSIPPPVTGSPRCQSPVTGYPSGSGMASSSYASPSYAQSSSVQNSPTSPSYIHRGHSTVPFKRHSSRVRNSIQSRYTMYPPIFEDCSEESENK